MTEYHIHCNIAEYLNLVIRKPSRWTTIEVSNQQAGRAGMFKQMCLKKKGVTTGFPDIMIIHVKKYGIKLIFLEVKAEGGKLTEKQAALHDELRTEGHFVAVVKSVDDTKKILQELGVV